MAIDSQLTTRLYSWKSFEDQVELWRGESGGLVFHSAYPQQPIDLGGRPAEDAISLLTRCHIERRNDSWVPLFFEYSPKWPANCLHPDHPGYGLSLVEREERFFWHLSNAETSSATWVAAEREDPVLSDYLIRAPEEDEEALHHFFQDYAVRLSLENERLTRVHLTLKHSFSHLDPTVRVDRDHYAVTLIIGGSSARKRDHALNRLIEKGHAMLAIDRVYRGVHSFWLAHIRAVSDREAQPEIYQGSPDQALLQGPTWQFPADQVEPSIQYLLNRPPRVPFNMTGNEIFDSRGWQGPERTIVSATRIGLFLGTFVKQIYVPPGLNTLSITTRGPNHVFNCLVWAIDLIRQWGARLPSPGTFASPKDYVEGLIRNPESVAFGPEEAFAVGEDGRVRGRLG